MRAKWIDMKIGCDCCGKPLEGRPDYSPRSFIIKGYEPMEWRHTDGTKECVIVISRRPRPYSDANQYRDYLRRVQSEAQEKPSD